MLSAKCNAAFCLHVWEWLILFLLEQDHDQLYIHYTHDFQID